MFIFFIIVIVSAVFVFFYYRGNRVLKLYEDTLKRIGIEENDQIDQLGYVSYHGGLPEIPRPQKLTIATSGRHLILITNQGEVGRSLFSQCRKIEYFTSFKKGEPKQQSMMIWGPLNPLLFKDQRRHFIVIYYRDSRSQDNHILLEHSKLNELKEIFTKIDARWKNVNDVSVT